MHPFAFTILCCSIAIFAGCSDNDGSTSVDSTGLTPTGGKTHRLSGTVTNQFGLAAEGVYVVASNGSFVDSAITDKRGLYGLSNVAEGDITITTRSSELAGYNRLRYLPAVDSLTIDRDRGLNLVVHEYTVLFEDHGDAASLWTLHGGVTSDGSKYLFDDTLLQKDYMELATPLAVPPELDSLYFVVSGWASPADSGIILSTFYESGAEIGLTYSVFHPDQETKVFPVHNIAGIIGSNVTLELEQMAYYNPQPHPDVTTMINEVVIFGY